MRMPDQTPLERRVRRFTITEFAFLVSLLSLIASIVFIAVLKMHNDAVVAATIAEIKEVEKAIMAYHADTGVYPTKCSTILSPTNDLPCTNETDPLQVNIHRLAGWEGPYANIRNMRHLWGGDISISNQWDFFGDGGNDGVIILDDDIVDIYDNVGMIPQWALLGIDKALDDGNLTTGEIRSNVSFACVPGELCIRYDGGK